MRKDVRAYCLTAPEVRPSDLQHAFRLSYPEAVSALEELEALRLLGSALGPGPRRWAVSLPVNETRVQTLRKALGWQATT